jgi:hypothetical protein
MFKIFNPSPTALLVTVSATVISHSVKRSSQLDSDQDIHSGINFETISRVCDIQYWNWLSSKLLRALEFNETRQRQNLNEIGSRA